MIFIITALLISTIPLSANSNKTIDEHIKALEAELQKAMQSTYLPNDEQLSRIKKELDLLKMQQELDFIKSKRTQSPQVQEKQTPQYFESQTTQTKDSRFNGANQSNYQPQETKAKEYIVSNYNGNATTRSGIFFGFEVGYGEAKMTISMPSLSVNERKGGINYGVTLGYNHFFNNYFGGRIYASVNAQNIRFTKAMRAAMATNTMVMSIAWGGNLDLIVNFVALKNFDFGMYAGVFVGANTFINGDLYDLEEKGFVPQYTCLDFGINVGLRTMIAKNIGVEISARVPFLESKILDNAPAQNLITGAMGTFSILGKQSYNVNVRFLYKF